MRCKKETNIEPNAEFQIINYYQKDLFIYLFIFFYTEQKHRLFSKPAAYVVIAGDR